MTPGRWRWVALGPLILIFAGVIFVTIGQRQLSWPEIIVREAVAPLQSGVARIVRSIDNVTTTIANMGRLSAENKLLQKELTDLRAERSVLLEAQRENAGLREILQLAQAEQRLIAVAEVIARNPNHWFETVTINKGRVAGVARDMAVNTPEGVIGRIYNVTPHTAEVLLISDSKSSLGGRIQRSGEVVLVEGIGGAGEALCRVKLLNRQSEIEPGDVIVTSGLSEVFPKGIPIGVIEEVREERYGLITYGILRPSADLSRLEWVTVVSE